MDGEGFDRRCRLFQWQGTAVHSAWNVPAFERSAEGRTLHIARYSTGMFTQYV